MAILKPDMGKILYLAIGFLVLPKVISMVASR